MEGTRAAGRRPFMPDSALNRRSEALGGWKANNASFGHQIIPRTINGIRNRSNVKCFAGEKRPLPINLCCARTFRRNEKIHKILGVIMESVHVILDIPPNCPFRSKIVAVAADSINPLRPYWTEVILPVIKDISVLYVDYISPNLLYFFRVGRTGGAC